MNRFYENVQIKKTQAFSWGECLKIQIGNNVAFTVFNFLPVTSQTSFFHQVVRLLWTESNFIGVHDLLDNNSHWEKYDCEKVSTIFPLSPSLTKLRIIKTTLWVSLGNIPVQEQLLLSRHQPSW